MRWVAQLARAISRSAPPFLPALLLSSTSTENFCGPASVVGPRHRTFVCFVECCVVLPLGAFFRNPSLCLQRTQHLFNRKIVRQKVEYLGLHRQKCIQQRKYFSNRGKKNDHNSFGLSGTTSCRQFTCAPLHKQKLPQEDENCDLFFSRCRSPLYFVLLLFPSFLSKSSFQFNSLKEGTTSCQN